jgi:hypothetical protein
MLRAPLSLHPLLPLRVLHAFCTAGAGVCGAPRAVARAGAPGAGLAVPLAGVSRAAVLHRWLGAPQELPPLRVPLPRTGLGAAPRGFCTRFCTLRARSLRSRSPPPGAASRGSSTGAEGRGLYCELVSPTRDHLLASQPEGGAPMEVPRRSALGGGRFLKMTVEFKLLTKPLS